jgi:hypothetical protein
MPAEVVRRGPFLALGLTVLIIGLSVLVLGFRAADAQTAGVQVTSFPGATVTVDATRSTRLVTRALVTSCPDGYEAISGGWSATPLPAPGSWQVVETYPSQRPSGLGPGQWTLEVAVMGGRLTITPYVTCLGGTSQLPE